MNETLISLSEFFELRQSLPILDARSEAEFSQSHLPNAFNIPILNNQERVVVGTLYKNEGSEKATLKGFELVGPRFNQIQKEAIELFPEREIILYCWRGGMRSQILSWLLSMVGFKIFRIKGGYKTYRTFTYQEVRKQRKILVLGGKTGVGKTVLLEQLQRKGEQIIDLEGLANHKGSSFGSIGQNPQPTVEQFENMLAEQLLQLDTEKVLWLENESRKIGRIILPDLLNDQMRSAKLVDIQKSENERIQHISEEYGSLPKAELIAAIKRLSKKLGGVRTQQAIEDIENGNTASWVENVLIYYDKAYDFDLEKHATQQVNEIDLSEKSWEEQAELLITLKNKIYGG